VSSCSVARRPSGEPHAPPDKPTSWWGRLGLAAVVTVSCLLSVGVVWTGISMFFFGGSGGGAVDVAQVQGTISQYFNISLLAFLPVSHRKQIRDSWYAGLRSERGKLLLAPRDWLTVESVRGYRTDDPQQELYRHIEQRLAKGAGLERDLDRCDAANCRVSEVTAAKARVDRAMHRIAGMGGTQLRVFPDVSFVRVHTGDAENDLAYTLIRNKAYKNVTSILTDEKHRELEDQALDTLTVVDWLEGSYPNIFFVVDLGDIEAFAERYLTIQDRDDYEQFVALYGVRRTSTGFWETADWFHAQYAREQPVLSGLFDLNRYRNR